MSLETAFSAGTPIAASKMPITPATLRSDAATRAAPDDMVACNTVGELVRSTIGAGLREPSGLSGAADSDSASLGSNPSPPASIFNMLGASRNKQAVVRV
jgi:hypothetical protein